MPTPDEAARLEQLHAKATDPSRDPSERVAAATEGVELYLATHDRDVQARVAGLEKVLLDHLTKKAQP